MKMQERGSQRKRKTAQPTLQQQVKQLQEDMDLVMKRLGIRRGDESSARKPVNQVAFNQAMEAFSRPGGRCKALEE